MVHSLQYRFHPTQVFCTSTKTINAHINKRFFITLCFLRCVEENKWTDALNLCRTVNDETVWACLAVLATQSNTETLDIAEESYGNINHYEKVLYLQYTKVQMESIHQNILSKSYLF